MHLPFRQHLTLMTGVMAILALALVSIAYGATVIPLGDVLRALAHAAGLSDTAVNGPVGKIIVDLRLPRVILAICVGAGLGIIGALLQTVTRNVRPGAPPLGRGVGARPGGADRAGHPAPRPLRRPAALPGDHPLHRPGRGHAGATRGRRPPRPRGERTTPSGGPRRRRDGRGRGASCPQCGAPPGSGRVSGPRARSRGAQAALPQGAIVHGVCGTSRTFMGEEASSIDAARIAVARVGAGQSDIALVGAAHNGDRGDLLMLYSFGDFALKDQYAPVWARRNHPGFAIGSAGAFLVMESREHAEARGAKPYAKLTKVVADLACVSLS
ncbi:hypothetical protein BLX87_24615 [Bacillus sp. VT-16-64]|nr:hypothetical protein BLX87_24615 [Bacillus sp. VT-16-64]